VRSRYYSPAHAAHVKLSSRLFRSVGVHLNQPEILARAWLNKMWEISVDFPENAREQKTLLVLPKPGGIEDWTAILEKRGDTSVRLLGIDRVEIKYVFGKLVGQRNKEILNNFDYRPNDPSTSEGKEAYRKFLVSVLGVIRKELNLSAILSSNFFYGIEREIAAACEEIDLPFLVLHKESIRSPRQREIFTQAYRERYGPFSGRSLAVYNQDERLAQLSSGVFAEPVVVGCPRVDYLHQHRGSATLSSGKLFVLFAVDPGAGTWTPFDDQFSVTAPRWNYLAEATNNAFLNIANRNPDKSFIVKAKGGQEHLLFEGFPDNLPRNLKLSSTGTATEWIRKAEAVVAFNSTVVPEAVAAGVRVIVPGFGEAADSDSDGWKHPVPAKAGVAGSPDLLEELMFDTGGNRKFSFLDSRDKDYLQLAVGNPDGDSAQRGWDWLRSHL